MNDKLLEKDILQTGNVQLAKLIEAKEQELRDLKFAKSENERKLALMNPVSVSEFVDAFLEGKLEPSEADVNFCDNCSFQLCSCECDDHSGNVPLICTQWYYWYEEGEGHVKAAILLCDLCVDDKQCKKLAAKSVARNGVQTVYCTQKISNKKQKN